LPAIASTSGIGADRISASERTDGRIGVQRTRSPLQVISEPLQAANISKKDSQARVVDFHSLRHTFCTNLHRAGVPQREAMELMRHNDPRLTVSTYTDTSLPALRDAVQKLTISPSQIASQILGAAGHSPSSPDAMNGHAKGGKTIENKGGKSLSGTAGAFCRKSMNGARCRI